MAGPGSRRSRNASNLALPILAGVLPLGALTLLALPGQARAATSPGNDAIALANVPAEPHPEPRSWPELAALPPLSAEAAPTAAPTLQPDPAAAAASPPIQSSSGSAIADRTGAGSKPSGDLAQAAGEGSPAPEAPSPAADPLSPAGDAPAATPATPEPTPAPAPPSPSLQPQAAQEPKVLISEVVIEGLDGHPEKEVQVDELVPIKVLLLENAIDALRNDPHVEEIRVAMRAVDDGLGRQLVLALLIELG